jgi:hypothetical protein
VYLYRMEPEWTKAISSTSICNIFYAFFVINATIFVLSVLTTIGIFSYGKNMGNFGMILGIQSILSSLIAGIVTLSYYLVCDRALLAGKAEKKGNMEMIH